MPCDVARMDRQETVRRDARAHEIANQRSTCPICSQQDTAPIKQTSPQAQRRAGPWNSSTAKIFGKGYHKSLATFLAFMQCSIWANHLLVNFMEPSL